MEKEKVTVLIISKKESPKQDFMDNVFSQDYENYDVLFRFANYPCCKQHNIQKNSEDLRKIALSSDSKYFLLLDTDIQMPVDAITNLMKQKQLNVISAWFKLPPDFIDYNCSIWVADYQRYNCKSIENSVVKVDVVHLGCLLISREVLEKITFTKEFNDCQCSNLSIDIQDAGYVLHMDSSVVCKHKGV